MLVQNEPAIRLYEKLGFVRVRGLEVWALDGLVFQKHKVRPVAAAAAQERIRAERTWREPWQRADESVANYDDVEALESERGAILFRRAGDRVWLLQGSAADEEAARGSCSRSRRRQRARLAQRAGGRSVQRRDRLLGGTRASPARAAAVALVDLVEADDAPDAVLGLHQLEAAVDLLERQGVGEERIDVELAGEQRSTSCGTSSRPLIPPNEERRSGGR